MSKEKFTRNIAGVDRKWWILLSVGIGTFMSALDASIVNTILPVIRDRFGCEVATVQWAVTIYLLAVSSLLLLFGRLGDLRGHKLIYTSGFGLFVVGSALCGLSPGAGTLIAFRGIQAIGAAMLFASAPAILTMNFPAVQRGQALGLQATMTYLGLAFGPALGGWLAEALSWRAVFYINVPIGALGLAWGMYFIPSGRGQETAERFDYRGAAAFMLGLVALLLALNQGHEWGWASRPILLLFAASAALLIWFVLLELRTRQPMLDLSLFANRVFSAATAAAIFNYICMYTIAFLMPFYLIQGRGLNSARAGLLLTVQPLVMAVAAPISGTISDRIRSSLPSSIGMAILAGGSLFMSLVSARTPYLYIAAVFCLTGLGTGIFISPNNSALMGSAPANRQGIAAGMLATARNVGMVLGVGLSGAVLTTVLAKDSHRTIIDAVDMGLHVATIAAVLGAAASLIRHRQEKNVDAT
jgi:EmrB/QacA subfamily drug resistance transporter